MCPIRHEQLLSGLGLVGILQREILLFAMTLQFTVKGREQWELAMVTNCWLITPRMVVSDGQHTIMQEWWYLMDTPLQQ